MWSLRTACLATVLFGKMSTIHGNFGDYADPTFECPAKTTCQQVCVANVTDCPTEMLCSNGEMLCADGTCAPFCTGNEISPCQFSCASVACNKVIDFFNLCQEKYDPLYKAEAACGAAEVAQAVHLWTFKEAGFLFFYIWICAATVLLVTWCAYNQRMAPVEGSTQSLELSFSTKADKTSSQGWQTGYQVHPIGAFVNFITVVTLLGIQVLLAWLTIQYYIQQGLITDLHGVFDDQVQVLIIFEITWGTSLSMVSEE